MRELENTQQSNRTQAAQINTRHEDRQDGRDDGDQINQAEQTGGVAPAPFPDGGSRLLVFGIGPQSQEVLGAEDDDRDVLNEIKRKAMRLINRFDRLNDDRNDVDENQNNDETIDPHGCAVVTPDPLQYLVGSSSR